MGSHQRGADASLVGRDAEVARVRGLVESAEAGISSTLLLSGEAGIGKTTVMASALAGTRPRGLIVLHGAGLPLASLSSPFRTVRGMLRDLPEGVAPMPVVRGEGSGASGWVGVDPVEFDAWLDEVSADRPVVLAVDDLHWVDRETLDVLRYVIAGGRSRSVGVVMTLRSEEIGEGHRLHRWLADVRRLPGFSESTLGPLDRFDTGRQMAATMGGVPHESLVEEVYRRSGGNPYLTRLLVAGVSPSTTSLPAGAAAGLEDAVLTAWHELSPGARQLTTVLAIAGRGLDRADLVDLVQGQLDPERVPMWLDEAVAHAVLDVDGQGRYWFHHPLQAELLEARAHPQDRRDWHSVCATLLTARLRSDGNLSDEATRVVAVADHYYAAGMSNEAYEWSLQVASGLDGAVGAPDVVRSLRRAIDLHSTVDDPVEQRIDLLRRLRHATAAAGDFEAELDAVAALLHEMRRNALHDVVAELLVRRIHLLYLLRRRMFRISDAEEAVATARRCPGSWQEALALAQLSTARLWTLETGTSLVVARAEADEAASIAERSGNPLALAHALSAQSHAALVEDDLIRARQLARKAHEEAIGSGDYWAFRYSSAMEINALGIHRAREVRDLAEARRRHLADVGAPHTWVAILATDVVRPAVRVGDVQTAGRMIRYALGAKPGPFADYGTRLCASRLALLTGAIDEAHQHLARAEELAQGLSEFRAWGEETARAELLVASGETRAAFEFLLSSLRRGGESVTMSEWWLPLAAGALADLVEAAGASSGGAKAVLDEVEELEALFQPGSPDGTVPSPIPGCGSFSDPTYRTQHRAFEAWYVAELARARRSCEAPGQWERAANALDEAELPWEAAYAWMRLGEARLLGDRSERKAAAAALRGAVERATPLEARPVLDRVAALARTARIDVSVIAEHPDEAPPSGLTRREREILRHVVAGRTYSQIAEALVVSEKTVSSHISNMLRKTGTANRVELAVWSQKGTP